VLQLAWSSSSPRPSHLGGIIASMTRHRHCAAAKLPRQRHHQHDSAPTLRHGQVTSAAPSPAWLGGHITPWPTSPRQWRHQHDSGAWRLLTRLAVRLGGSPPIRLEGLDEYHSNRQLDSGTFSTTSSTTTLGECVVTTMLWDTLLKQLSHFLSCILFRVNISIYFQLVNILPLV
jgi:hypothetical protein